MSCPGCGSSLWNNEKCPACGRLASDTSRRLGSHPEPAVAARRAVGKGAFGGAIAGYIGGGPLDLDAIGNGMLIGAGIGAVIGLAVAAWLAWESGDRDPILWLFAPGIAAGVAFLIGFKQAFDWTLGWAVAQQATGLAAAGLGAVMGGVLAAGFANAAALRRDRAYDKELQRIAAAREQGRAASPVQELH